MKNKGKNIIGLFIFFYLSLFLISCNKKEQFDIVTTLYPQYDIAKQIAGDKLSVSLMTPFGTEVHAYEPTAKDIITVNNSKLFIYTSNEMERWANNIAKDKTNALNLSTTYIDIPYDNEIAIKDTLHYWTDPLIIIQLITIIKDKIIEIDPTNKDYYEENALNYIDEIILLSDDFIEFLKLKDNPTVFFYGHNALTSFASRYNLNIVSLNENYKPNAELSPGQILNLKNKIKETNAKYLFIEELIDLKAPNSLKNELESEGYVISLLELHSFHNISKTQNRKGVRYVDLLKQNFENLKIALN